MDEEKMEIDEGVFQFDTKIKRLNPIDSEEEIDSPPPREEVVEIEEDVPLAKVVEIEESAKKERINPRISPDFSLDSEKDVTRYCMHNCLNFYELVAKSGLYTFKRGKFLNYIYGNNDVSSPNNVIFAMIEEQRKTKKKIPDDELLEAVSKYRSPVVWLDTCEFTNPKKYGFLKLPEKFNFTSVIADFHDLKDIMEKEKEKISSVPKEYKMIEIESTKEKEYHDGIGLCFDVHFGEFNFLWDGNKSKQLFIDCYLYDDETHGKNGIMRSLAILHEKEVVAFLQLFRDSNDIVGIYNISVAPGHRRKRLCTKLLVEAVRIVVDEWRLRYICGLGSPDGKPFTIFDY